MENRNFKGKNLADKTLNQVNKVKIACNENIVCLIIRAADWDRASASLAFLAEMDSDLISMKQHTRLRKGTFYKVAEK